MKRIHEQDLGIIYQAINDAGVFKKSLREFIKNSYIKISDEDLDIMVYIAQNYARFIYKINVN